LKVVVTFSGSGVQAISYLLGWYVDAGAFAKTAGLSGQVDATAALFRAYSSHTSGQLRKCDQNLTISLRDFTRPSPDYEYVSRT
jgi:hypothetical protein